LSTHAHSSNYTPGTAFSRVSLYAAKEIKHKHKRQHPAAIPRERYTTAIPLSTQQAAIALVTTPQTVTALMQLSHFTSNTARTQRLSGIQAAQPQQRAIEPAHSGNHPVYNHAPGKATPINTGKIAC
jgi:hypothetical protein